MNDEPDKPATFDFEREKIALQARDSAAYAAHLQQMYELASKKFNEDTAVRTNHYNLANRVNRISLVLNMVVCACFGVLAVVLVTKLL